jgi:ankyrin repeat protein
MKPAWKQACQLGDLAAMAALLDSGLDINARDEHSQTALMNAAKFGNIPVVRFLLERGADPDAHAKYGLTALMLAVINYHEEIAHLLIDAGADLSRRGTGAPGFFGKRALELAQERDQAAIVAHLERCL